MVRICSLREEEVLKALDSAIEHATARPWMPGLAPSLKTLCLDRLNRDMRADFLPYSTTRMLVNSDAPPGLVVAHCGVVLARRTLKVDEGIQVECIPEGLRGLMDRGLRFCPVERITEETVLRLDEALAFLGLVPSVWRTVFTVVRSLHIIESEEEDVDVSWSTPDLPFSVCVSLPNDWTDIAVVRTAESILHEAMHLQLSLIERIVPLVGKGEGYHYSPWRKEWRPASGILQALYVFRVICSFFQAVQLRVASPAVEEHLLWRVLTIKEQMKKAEAFRECEVLTPIGHRLVREILRGL